MNKTNSILTSYKETNANQLIFIIIILWSIVTKQMLNWNWRSEKMFIANHRTESCHRREI